MITSQVTSQHPPQAARFETICKSFWSTLGFAIKYDGDIQIQTTGPNQVAARYNLKLQWNSALGLILTQGATAIIAIMVNPYYAGFAIFLIIGVMAFTAWNVSSGVPEKALEQFVKNLQTGSAAPIGGFQPQPAPQAFTPQPAPTAAPQPTPAPQPASAGGDSAVIMEQIKQLGSLRDTGVLTPEEFEAKKAELLKRI